MTKLPPAATAQAPTPQRSNSALAWTALGLGVGSLVIMIVPYYGAPIALGLAIAGLVVAIIALKKGSLPKWAAIVGLVFSSVMLFMNAITLLFIVAAGIGFIGSLFG